MCIGDAYGCGRRLRREFEQGLSEIVFGSAAETIIRRRVVLGSGGALGKWSSDCGGEDARDRDDDSNHDGDRQW